MRKQLTLIVGLIAILGLSSCTKEEIIQKINYNRILTYTINENEWHADPERTDRWVAELDFPEIDDFIINNGSVLVDISFGNGIYEPLTTVYDGVAYRYDYRRGILVIDAAYADGLGGDLDRPARANIKVILVEAERY